MYVLNNAETFKASLTWAGFSSLTAQSNSISRVCLLPTIPESPTQLSVQFTVINYLEKLTNSVNPAQKKVVVTVDLALYKPMKQFEMARVDCQGKWLLKPGELHIVIAQLRTLGDFIRGSGLPELWIECDLYSPATVKQILEGKHVRRAIDAHVTMASALNILLLEEYEKANPGKLSELDDAIKKLASKLQCQENDGIVDAIAKLRALIDDKKIIESLNTFILTRSEAEPLFKMACTYLDLVQIMW